MAQTSPTASLLERAKLLFVRALASNTLCGCVASHYGLMDAASRVKILATGGTLPLDGAGRHRAGQLDAIVRVRAVA